MAVTEHLSNSEGHQDASLSGINFGEFAMESGPQPCKFRRVISVAFKDR